MGNSGDGLMKSKSHLNKHHAKEAEMKEKSAKVHVDQKAAFLEKIKSLQKKQSDSAEK